MLPHLTKRESEIVELIASGNSIKDISNTCFISQRTTEKHIQSVYDKIEIKRSLNALTAWYFCTKFNLEIDGISLKQRITSMMLLLLIVPNVLCMDLKQSRRVSSKRYRKEISIS